MDKSVRSQGIVIKTEKDNLSFNVYTARYAAVSLILKLEYHFDNIKFKQNPDDKHGILIRSNHENNQDNPLSLKQIPFNLDLLWIHNSGEIKQIDHNCRRKSDRSYRYHNQQNSEIAFIFETLGGICRKYDIKQGDFIQFMSLKYNNILPLLCDQDLAQMITIKNTLNQFIFCEDINRIIAEYSAGSILNCSNSDCANVIFFYHTFNIDQEEEYYISPEYDTDGVIYCHECKESLVSCEKCDNLCLKWDCIEVAEPPDDLYNWLRICEECASDYFESYERLIHYDKFEGKRYLNTNRKKSGQHVVVNGMGEYRLEHNQHASHLVKSKLRHRKSNNLQLGTLKECTEKRWSRTAISDWKFRSNTQQILKYYGCGVTHDSFD